ncbi:MAG: ABC-2 transporter permease [Defluviitaleaceae bacterium]|nr:ABC-2 transporter permease [Defluviitaleaceae bacterium]
MSKLAKFIRLDLMTIKPYFKTTGIFIVGLLLAFTYMGSAGASAISGAIFGILVSTYPFVISEKTNLDALYATLSLDRKTVVLGRYLFVLLVNICIFAVVIIGAAIFSLIDGAEAAKLSDGLAVVVIWLGLVVVQTIQLPIYFKFSYTKAKLIALLPFFIFTIGFTFFPIAFLEGDSTGINVWVFKLINSSGIISVGALAVAVGLYASYRLSVGFYSKREF